MGTWNCRHTMSVIKIQRLFEKLIPPKRDYSCTLSCLKQQILLFNSFFTVSKGLMDAQEEKVI